MRVKKQQYKPKCYYCGRYYPVFGRCKWCKKHGRPNYFKSQILMEEHLKLGM